MCLGRSDGETDGVCNYAAAVSGIRCHANNVGAVSDQDGALSVSDHDTRACAGHQAPSIRGTVRSGRNFYSLPAFKCCRTVSAVAILRVDLHRRLAGFGTLLIGYPLSVVWIGRRSGSWVIGWVGDTA